MYSVVAYYHFCPIENPKEEVELHQEFCQTLDMKGRIYISEEGINGQMSIADSDLETYATWLRERPYFKTMPLKIHSWHSHAFEKLKIKYRKQLVAIDCPVDMKKTAPHLSPKEWREKLDQEKDFLLIDVRNDYETKVGTFAGAETPPCNTFREFKEYSETIDHTKPILMCCTGGIRCEVYSAYLKERGFETVYQLEGGIINYGLKEGGKHWLGKLFVFDDRMTVPITTEETPVIGQCELCGTAADEYYNCANMDCNHLFLACPSCIDKQSGCCSKECESASRVRPRTDQNPHKPFRKKYRYTTKI